MIQPSPALASASAAESQKLMGTSPTSKESSVGAFTAPTSSMSGNVKPVTTALSIDPGTGTATTSSKPPIPIPDIPWGTPRTVVQGSTKGERVVITYAGDGDGFSFKNSKGGLTECRVDSFNAPETAKPSLGKSGQRFGEEAKKMFQDMVLNKEVTVRVVKPAAAGPPSKSNNWGRATCQVEIEGKNIDTKMVAAGAGWVMSNFVNRPDLEKAQSEAKASRKGLWADPNPMDPTRFRQLQNAGVIK